MTCFQSSTVLLSCLILSHPTIYIYYKVRSLQHSYYLTVWYHVIRALLDLTEVILFLIIQRKAETHPRPRKDEDTYKAGTTWAAPPSRLFFRLRPFVSCDKAVGSCDPGTVAKTARLETLGPKNGQKSPKPWTRVMGPARPVWTQPPRASLRCTGNGLVRLTARATPHSWWLFQQPGPVKQHSSLIDPATDGHSIRMFLKLAGSPSLPHRGCSVGGEGSVGVSWAGGQLPRRG